jgi:hypothetical protein
MGLLPVPISRAAVSRCECDDLIGEIALPLVGEKDPPLCPTAMLLLAFAAPVFADSSIFLKNPCFFAFGVASPPNTLFDSSVVVADVDQGMAEEAPCREVL